LEELSLKRDHQRSLKTYARKQKKLREEQAMEQARIGLTGYPEVEFKPVPITTKEDLMKKSKYDQMIHQE